MADYVDKFIESIAGETSTYTILDVGIGNGEKSMALAKIGHTVIGITNCEAEYQRAERNARQEGLSNCTFEVMEVQKIKGQFDPGFFDIVIASRVLHLLPKESILPTIKSLKNLTAPGGRHIIQGYLVDQELSQSEANCEKMFKPGELERIYSGDGGWEVTDYIEDPFKSQIVGTQEWVSSLVKMTARKSKTPRSR